MIKRHIKARIIELLKDFRIVYLTGLACHLLGLKNRKLCIPRSFLEGLSKIWSLVNG